MAPPTVTRQQAIVGGVGALALTAAAILGHFVAQSGATAMTCSVKAGVGATAIQSAVDACANGGTVQLAAGTYALNNRVVVRHPETISGAGPQSTFLVQHADVNIFQIKSPGVTVENMNLDTGTYNPGVPPVLKNPVPSVLFSAASHTSVINVTAKAGTGYGLRIVGPQPCTSYGTTGTVVSNLNMTSTGSGGFASVDISCTNGAQLSGITVNGNIIAFYIDENVVLNGETYHPGPYNKPCDQPWYITGPSNTLLMENVLSYGGKGIARDTGLGVVTGLTVTNNTWATNC